MAKIVDPTSGSEDAELTLETVVGGELAHRMTVGQGVKIGSPTGGDPGPGKLNATDVQYTNRAVKAIVDHSNCDWITFWHPFQPTLRISACDPTTGARTPLYEAVEEALEEASDRLHCFAVQLIDGLAHIRHGHYDGKCFVEEAFGKGKAPPATTHTQRLPPVLKRAPHRENTENEQALAGRAVLPAACRLNKLISI
jgi:hypothetical protein